MFFRSINNFLLLLTLFFGSFSNDIISIEYKPDAFRSVGISQNILHKVNTDISFINQDGIEVSLNSYIGKGRSTVLNFIYFSCPMLCNLVLTGLTQTLNEGDFNIGEDFNIITISIHPGDSSQNARSFRNKYLSMLGRSPDSELDWHFLTGNQDAISEITSQVGFLYKYIPETEDYSHPSVQIILSPEGRIVRYLNGLQYPALDLKLALLESKEASGISTVERAILFCYNYDPDANSYVLYAMNLMRLAGALTFIMIMIFITVLKLKEKKAKKYYGK